MTHPNSVCKIARGVVRSPHRFAHRNTFRSRLISRDPAIACSFRALPHDSIPPELHTPVTRAYCGRSWGDSLMAYREGTRALLMDRLRRAFARRCALRIGRGFLMVRRIILLGVLGLGAFSATGCVCRPILHGPCGSPIFPGLRPLLRPHTIGAPMQSAPISLAPMSYGGSGGGYESMAPIGYGASAPGCTTCGNGGGGPIGGMPIGPAPVGYSQPIPTISYGQPNYSGSGMPHDSMLLPAPTVVPPSTGRPSIEIDPPKSMPK